MLTRIEIDGFKSFEGFSLALPSFAVILGPNAAGKSNLFDALRLLSQLAITDVRSAMRDLRGEPHELFRQLPDGTLAPRLSLAVETLLEPRVKDDYGQDLKLSCTRIRYEIAIVRRMVSGIERFFIERERATPIRKEEDRWQPYGQPPSAAFRAALMKYSSRRTPFLDTVDEAEGQSVFQLHQDNKQGKIRRLPAIEAERSVLSTVTLAREFPHLYALQKELKSLRYLQLDPAAERRPSPLDAPELLERDGSNLAAVLYRIQQETMTEDRPRGVLADVLADLAEIVPGVIDLDVERDDKRREYRLQLIMRDGQPFSSRVVSDGTLRILALLALLHDPRHRGILCFEEPENGVHKTRLEALMRFLQESCAQPNATEVDADSPLLQIFVNTHSPIAARAVKNTIILASLVDIVEPDTGLVRRCTRMLPYMLSEQGELSIGEGQRRYTSVEIERFLEESERTGLAA
jgi:predicted ATPase